jgi:hypothetical protein
MKALSGLLTNSSFGGVAIVALLRILPCRATRILGVKRPKLCRANKCSLCTLLQGFLSAYGKSIEFREEGDMKRAIDSRFAF